jgi:methionyl-tRNA formyltransferase
MLNVLLVAEEAAGLQALKLLAESDHRVTAVLSSTGEERGAGVARAAAGLGLPIADPRAVRDPAFADRLRDQGIDLLVNVHSLHIAAAEVVDAPRIGSFNLHPGPLPEYAGLNAPSWAIFEGRSDHAVTLHWMEADVDAGPIAYSTTFPIESEDTGASLMAKCVRHGVPLVGRLLEDAEDGRIPRREQNASGRRWHGRDAPHGGRLPWALPAARVADFVRAADYSPFESPWGHPTATLGDRQVEVVRVSRTGEPAEQPPGSIGPDGWVATADEWLRVERLREDGRTVRPGEVLRTGYRFEVDLPT